MSEKIKPAVMAVIAILLSMAAPSQVAGAEQSGNTGLAGTATVIDGDTIEIHGEPIRLKGFDTPEAGAMCGRVNVYQQAALALSDFIGSRTVTCDISGNDRYGRKIGQCRIGDDGLAEHMVQRGWGRDWPRYSKGAYAEDELNARNSGAGIWGLDCPDDLWGSRNYD